MNLLNVCCGVEEADDTVKCNGYLLLVAVDSIECGTDTPVWEGERVTVNPTVETAIGLADIQVEICVQCLLFTVLTTFSS